MKRFLHKSQNPEAVFRSVQHVSDLMILTQSQHFFEQILVNKYEHEDVVRKEGRNMLYTPKEGSTYYSVALWGICTLREMYCCDWCNKSRMANSLGGGKCRTSKQRKNSVGKQGRIISQTQRKQDGQYGERW